MSRERKDKLMEIIRESRVNAPHKSHRQALMEAVGMSRGKTKNEVEVSEVEDE